MTGTPDLPIQYQKLGSMEMAYVDTGHSGERGTVLLIHGFASNLHVNWVGTGWVSFLRDEGYRVIALDNRGHGHSEKFYNTTDYGAPIMAEDARALMDALKIDQAHVMGYSMGARITAFLAMAYPERVKSAVFAGLGIAMVKGVGGAEPIAEALEAESADAIEDVNARMFRAFAEKTGGDLKALAACMRSARVRIKSEALSKLSMPVLVAVGTEDEIAGPPGPLADIIPNARAVDIPRRDHNRAVGDKVYKQEVSAFLADF